MKKLIELNPCNECGKQDDYYQTACDTCGSNLDIYEIGNHTFIRLNIDNTDYDFCNYTCLLQFIIGELRKQQPKENADETQS